MVQTNVDRGADGGGRRGEAGRDPSVRTVVVGGLSLALAFALLGLVWLLARPLALLALGIAIGEALSPPVGWLERRLPRAVAIVTVYLVLILVVLGLGWIIVPTLVAQVQEAAEHLPDMLKRGQQVIASWGGAAMQRVGEVTTSMIEKGSGFLVALPVKIVSSLLEVLVVLFISIYWLVVVRDLRAFFLSLFPAERRPAVEDVLSEMGHNMGGFLRGTAINGAIIAVLTFVGLLIIGVDFAIVLGLLAGMLEMLPFAGPVIAAVPIVGIALLESPGKALIALLFVVVLQQTEGHILVPNIMHKQAAISPLVAVLALVAGAELGGMLGAIVSVPLAAGLRVLVIRVVAPAVRGWLADRSAG